MFPISAYRPAFASVLGFLIVALVALAVPTTAQSERLISVYQKNMSFGITTERKLANDILASGADVVTLQEVNRDNDKIFAMLADKYPHKQFCTFRGIGGVAVLSRWPIVNGQAECVRPLGVAAMRVKMPEGKVWVMSLHLETRDKPRHARQAEQLGNHLQNVPGPMIIGGDFNNLPQAGSVRDVARGGRLARIGEAITTYRVNGMLGIPIDFVFASGGRGSVTQMPLLGSDHYGVLAEFTMDF